MFSIGQTSALSGIKVPTIRYYEEIGLVKVTTRSTGNQRRYSTAQLERLKFVKHARELGFSIDSVRQLFNLSEADTKTCAEIDELASLQLNEVQNKIVQLTKLEDELKRMLKGCKNNNLGQCYVIESLSNHGLCSEDH